jgi:hypothetical protein
VNSSKIYRLSVPTLVVTLTCFGCSDKPDKRTDSSDNQAPNAVLSKPAPPATASSTPRPNNNQTLTLTGLTFIAPKEWAAVPIAPGPFAAKAAFRIPGTEADEQCMVRITHYPSMKGKDGMNIDRWASQFRGTDGKPLTQKSGIITKRDIADGKIRLTMAQFDGSMASGMSGTGSLRPDQRLVAAIVDHARGPHFVKITGRVAAMKKASESINAFLLTANIK